ncbi:uncharacterized protein LOC133534512 [Cydia pomonella]|uniref:uncharacterized protein LOC133534512 n=1 Tax=Cydia pomonella TaxID=82600 RepID=UPI002ADE3666|nr:uncharacterized protein LOC133534512 [Cydia pomonella]XP_061729653.1 uncharacterized protein LOC133534512 [Cydia pomonella]
MLKAASLLFMVLAAVAEITIRCGSEIGTSFNKTEVGVEGRYTVEWCTQIRENAKLWELQLEHTTDNKFNVCENNITLRQKHGMKMALHSRPLTLNITNRPNCNITCLSKHFDAVFSSCYKVSNKIIEKKETNEHAVTNTRVHSSMDTYHRIDNMFTSHQALNTLKPVVQFDKNDRELVATYNLHYIDVSGSFGMRTKEYKKNSTIREIDAVDWINIRGNCTPLSESATVVCHLPCPDAGNCVRLSLEYTASYRNSINDPSVYEYCELPSEEREMDPGMDPRVWWAIGALALTLTLLAACWAAHSRVLANLRKKVLHDWVHRYASYTAEHTPVVDPGHILLLYARDCEPAMEAVSVLKEMLEEGAPARVYDLFSADCMALYAQAPEEWLCGLLARPDVRVVLVQTPAAAALYAAQVSQDMHLQQPLLGARVQYKKPHYGDVLLQFALRLVRDMAPMQQEYARYYIATVSELESELVPQVAPYRRYELPAHAARLLADLRLPALRPAPLRRLDAALRRLRDYVRANENYLRDELMFI